MGLDVVIGLICAADRVGLNAPVTRNVGPRIQGSKLRCRSWKPAIEVGTVAIVVRLVGGVASIPKDDHGRNWKELVRDKSRCREQRNLP